MTLNLGSLGKILGLIDGNIDLGAITGLFSRIQALIDRAEIMAKRFRNDPEVTAFLNDVRGLLKLQTGETITKEEIATMRKRWTEGNAEPVYDRPTSKPIEPPPPPPPPQPASHLPYGDVLDFDPRNDPRFLQTDHIFQSAADRSKFVATDGKIGGFVPNQFFPFVIVGGQEVGGQWDQVHPVKA